MKNDEEGNYYISEKDGDNAICLIIPIRGKKNELLDFLSAENSDEQQKLFNELLKNNIERFFEKV